MLIFCSNFYLSTIIPSLKFKKKNDRKLLAFFFHLSSLFIYSFFLEEKSEHKNSTKKKNIFKFICKKNCLAQLMNYRISDLSIKVRSSSNIVALI